MAAENDWTHWLNELGQNGLHHVTVTEASERLGLAPRAGYLTRLCRKGKISGAYLSSGVWLIPVRWILVEARKKGLVAPGTEPLPFLNTESPESVRNPSGFSLANINLLILEMEEILHNMERNQA